MYGPGLRALQHAFNPLPEIFDHADSAKGDVAALGRLIPHLVRRGVRIARRGNWMLSAAHTDEDADRSIAAFAGALQAYREEVAP